jgi:prepilin-type N-terminal cleavage/methylation domain-containing protein
VTFKRTIVATKERAAARSAGYTLVEMLMVLAIISLLATIAVPLYSGAIDKGHRSTLVHDAGELYRSFMRYYVDEGVFPSTGTPVERALDLTNLAPLSTQGYFRQVESFMHKLDNNQVQNYDSPNIGSNDTQFWATINSKRQPGFILLVAHTNDLPFDRGTWYDGVYYVTAGGILPVKESQ